jgi:membrane protease YdiL (CAAX protease family)
MADFLPPRPRYARERALYSFLMLFCFGAMLTVRLLAKFLPDLFSSPFLILGLQLIVFLIPSLVFMRIRGRGYARALRLRPPFATHFPLLLAAFFTLLTGALLLSILFGGTDTVGNSAASFEKAAPLTWVQGLITVPLVALLPALCEELLFRGILRTELDRRGAWRALLVGSLLFALIHFDLANLPVYFFAGLLLTLTVYATDSLVAAMLAHALYNLLSLFIQRYLNALYSFTGNVELFLFLVILAFLVSLLVFCFFASKEYRSRAARALPSPRRDVPRDVQLYTTLDALCEIPILFCFALSIVGFILL